MTDIKMIKKMKHLRRYTKKHQREYKKLKRKAKKNYAAVPGNIAFTKEDPI